MDDAFDTLVCWLIVKSLRDVFNSGASSGVSVGDSVLVDGEAACVIRVNGDRFTIRWAANGNTEQWNINWGTVSVTAVGGCLSTTTTTTTTPATTTTSKYYTKFFDNFF